MGVAERKNCDLLKKARAIILQMNVPKRFWSYGVLTAAYLINRLPSRVLDSKCPLEVLQVKQSKISHLRVFGCTCFVHLSANHHDKLDQRSVKCIFLGYSQTKKGYTCYDAVYGRVYVSRDVRFLERSPYFENSSKGEIMTDLFPFPNVEFSSPPSHNATQEHEHSSQDSIERPPDNATQEHENSLQDLKDM
nr:putative RNA-directed DNA polymerase [Tanacetum cinerariifolium]